MQRCPCGSKKKYTECCGRFIEGQHKPLTPEALMRSRYTAYTQANMNYLAETMRSPASDRFNTKLTSEWAKKVKWLRLEVRTAFTKDTKGFVEFIAYFKENGTLHAIHECSEFHCRHGVWYYVDGMHIE